MILWACSKKHLHVAELNERSLHALAESLVSLFKYFKHIGLASFNMALFIPIKPSPAYWTHVRVIPRLTIGALGTSDMNVFNFLHGEPLSTKVPEQNAAEAAKFF